MEGPSTILNAAHGPLLRMVSHRALLLAALLVVGHSLLLTPIASARDCGGVVDAQCTTAWESCGPNCQQRFTCVVYVDPFPASGTKTNCFYVV